MIQSVRVELLTTFTDDNRVTRSAMVQWNWFDEPIEEFKKKVIKDATTVHPEDMKRYPRVIKVLGVTVE